MGACPFFEFFKVQGKNGCAVMCSGCGVICGIKKLNRLKDVVLKGMSFIVSVKLAPTFLEFQQKTCCVVMCSDCAACAA